MHVRGIEEPSAVLHIECEKRRKNKPRKQKIQRKRKTRKYLQPQNQTRGGGGACKNAQKKDTENY